MDNKKSDKTKLEITNEDFQFQNKRYSELISNFYNKLDSLSSIVETPSKESMMEDENPVSMVNKLDSNVCDLKILNNRLEKLYSHLTTII